jgi:hypothetical protein
MRSIASTKWLKTWNMACKKMDDDDIGCQEYDIRCFVVSYRTGNNQLHIFL